MPYKEKNKHVATRSFQAFRIFINHELRDLESVLLDIPDYLTTYGRVVVISFHSLEDRIVKQHFNQLAKGTTLPKWVLLKGDAAHTSYKIIAKKIKATNKEIQQNIRSRSAILRAIEKVN